MKTLRLIGCAWGALAFAAGVSAFAPAARPLHRPPRTLRLLPSPSLPSPPLEIHSSPVRSPLSRSPGFYGRGGGVVRLSSREGAEADDEARAPMELPPHAVEDPNASPAPPTTLAGRVRAYFSGPADGLTFRQRLAKLGLNVALSYGWVSNMSYSVTVSLAWYIFSRRTGLSPLAPGQWKGFLAVYAGFWVFNNLVRPLRVALAVGVAPAFDRIVQGLQARLRVRRGTAVLVTVLLANLVGTTLAMSGGILLAAALAGVPVFAR